MNFRIVVFILSLPLMTFGAGAQPANEDPNFIAALTDVAAGRACERLEGQFRNLKSKGRDDESAVTGSLWIQECRASSLEDDPHMMKLSINAAGWRWIYQKKEKFAADFVVSEYGRFEVTIDILGRLDTHYDPQEKVLALWFLPQGEPKLSFSQVGDIEVNEEGLWASVLGGIASVFMQSPEAMAAETFQQLGRKKLTQQLEQGFSIAVDFCSGQIYTQMAKLSRQELVSALEIKPVNQATLAQMHPEGLLIVGPFSATSEKLQVKISHTSGNQLRAQLVCQDSAKRIASAFMDDEAIPEVRVLTDNTAGSLLTIDGAIGNCPIALVAQPAGQIENPFEFSYRVSEQRALKPLADCN